MTDERSRNWRALGAVAVLTTTFALTMPTWANAQQPLLGGVAGPSDKRCFDIDIELGQLENETVDLAERIKQTPMAARGPLQARLNEKRAREAELKREQSGCSRGPLVGSVTDGQTLSGGAATGAAEGLPGAPVPWGSTTPSVPRSGSPSAAIRTDGLTPAQRTALCHDKFTMSSRMRRDAPIVRAEIARLETEVGSPYTDTARRSKAILELTDTRERQDYIASQVSILEESMAGITGCSAATGTIVEVRPPTGGPTVPAGLAGTERTPSGTATPPPPALTTPPPAPPVAPPVTNTSRAAPPAPTAGTRSVPAASGAAGSPAQPCDAATFARLVGDWRSNNGPTTFRGSCANVSGTFTYFDSPANVPRSQWKTQTGVIYDGVVTKVGFKFKYRLPWISAPEETGEGGCTVPVEPLKERYEGHPVGTILMYCNVTSYPQRPWVFWRAP